MAAYSDVREDWGANIRPPAVRSNLIPNPSLERFTGGWVSYGASSFARSSAQALFGSYSLAITAPTGNGAGLVLPPSTLISGKTYTLSTYIYPLSAVGSTGIVIHTNAQGTPNFAFVGPCPANQWTRVSHTFVAGTEAAANGYLIYNNTGSALSYYIDGVQLEEGSSATAYIDGDQTGAVWSAAEHASPSEIPGTTYVTNLVVNPHLTSSAAGYSGYNCTMAASNTYGAVFGANALEVTSTVSGGAFYAGIAAFGDNASRMPVTGGVTYKASVWQRTAATSQQNRLEIGWWDASGAAIYTSATSYTGDSTSWAEKTLTAQAPANAAYASLDVYYTNSSAIGEKHSLDCWMFTNDTSASYFDGYSPDAAWAGTPDASISRKENIKLRNYVKDPSFETSALGNPYGWNTSGDASLQTGSIDTTQGQTGSRSGKIAVLATGGTDLHTYSLWSGSAGITATPGVEQMTTNGPMTFGCWMKGVSGRSLFARIVRQVNGTPAYGGAQDATTTVTATGAWQWVTVSIPSYVGTGSEGAQIRAGMRATTVQVGDTVNVDGATLVADSTVTTHITGESNRANWNGTAHASGSTIRSVGPLDELVIPSGSAAKAVAGGGKLTPLTATADKIFLLGTRPYLYTDVQNTLKYTIGAAVSANDTGCIIKFLDEQNYLVTTIGSSGTVFFYKNDGGSFVSLGTGAGTAPSAGGTYWLRIRSEGNVIVCQHFNADPATGVAPNATVTTTLTGANATKFGAGIAGYVGYRLYATAADYRYLDTAVEPFKYSSNLPAAGTRRFVPATDDLIGVLTTTGPRGVPVDVRFPAQAPLDLDANSARLVREVFPGKLLEVA